MSKFSVNFLGAAVPLTKCFRKDGTKDAYPMVKNFTSHTEQISTLNDFFGILTDHAKQGHCLLKGELTRTLNNESRVGTTRTDDMTRWICLDFDKYETPDLDLVLKRLGLGEVSYIIQYSASHGLKENEGSISAHVFMILDQALPAPMLKAWLMDLNLRYLQDGLKLNPTNITIKWPLDVTVCQNDKLIYIAPPIFEKPLKDPLQTRIKLVKRKLDSVAVAKMIGEPNITVVKKTTQEKLNLLRQSLGLPKRTISTEWVKGREVEKKPDVCIVTEVKDCGDFVRLNLNGGDSWAYWHPKENFELIHDFKSDTWYKTKELVPGYYETLVTERMEQAATPSEDGDLILAFCDLKTANYYRGLWNPEQQRLELHRARDRSQLNDWWMSFGRTPPSFIETWDITYDPRNDWIVDEENHRINTFKKSKYMMLEPDERVTPDDFPNIYHMIRHFLGEGGSDTSISDHFMNWFAVIFQRKDKPITAWVNHGVQGTGKGYFMSKVVRPLLGTDNVAEVGINNIEDQFNGWQEGKLFINVNEIDVDDFSEKGRVEAKFKMLITDHVMPVRRMQQTMTQEPNYGSYLFSSNKRRPVMIPYDDRRYNVGNRQTFKLVPPKEEDVANELEAFAKWLLAHQADVKLASEIIHTESRAAMQKLGVTSIEETCQTIIDGDFDALWMNMVDDAMLQRGSMYNDDERIYNELMRRIGKTIIQEGVRQTLSRDEIGIILQRNVGGIKKEPNKLTSLIRHYGIETKQVRHKPADGRKVYGIHVTWRVSDEIRAELEAEFGEESKPKLRRAK